MDDPPSIPLPPLPLPQQEQREQQRAPWDTLTPELWRLVFQFVPPQDLLQAVALVSKSFAADLRDAHYWKQHWKALLLQAQDDVDDLTRTIPESLSCHQLQLCCFFGVAQVQRQKQNQQQAPSADSNLPVVPSYLQYGSLLANDTTAEQVRTDNHAEEDSHFPDMRRVERRRVCLATSTEHDSELLENVLHRISDEVYVAQYNQLQALRQRHNNGNHMFFHHRFLSNVKWWSSRPSPTQESEDKLMFVTASPLTLLSDFKIRPLLDPFTQKTLYTWQDTTVQVYRLPLQKIQSTSNSSHNPPYNGDTPCSFHIHSALVPDEEGFSPTMHTTDATEAQIMAQVLEGEVPIYETQPLTYDATILSTSNQDEATMNDNDDNEDPNRPHCQGHVPWQHVRFPPGLVGNCIVVTLRGKHHKQFPHSGYYACVEQVHLDGIALPPSHHVQLAPNNQQQLPVGHLVHVPQERRRRRGVPLPLPWW